MIPLIISLLVLVLVVFPIWAVVKIIWLGRQNDALAQQLEELATELRRSRASTQPSAPREALPAATTLPTPVTLPATVASPAATTAVPPLTPASLPPVLPAPVAKPATVFASEAAPINAPPPVAYEPPKAPSPPRAGINWEYFTGANLLAWVGGLAAFLGAAFFIKYSFEHDLIPPEVRVALGYLFAIGLVIGGLKVPRERYAPIAQTLCATGVVSLYAVTFACNSIYHFAFFGPLATFLLMVLITATAFVLAVRLEAQVVAVLGILGGFLTPVLLSTGRDNPVGLFGYIALLDIGLIAVALHRRWHFLVPLGAAGTIAMQLGWAEKFLNAAKAPTAMVVCLVFCALFLGAYFAARFAIARATQKSASEEAELVPPHITWSAVAFPFVAFAFALIFYNYPSIAAQPALLFTFVLLADVCLLALAWRDEALPKLHFVAGIAVFALLAAWTAWRLTPELLSWALAFYLLHAVLHSAFPIVLERYRPAAAPTWWSQLFPPLTLLLMLGPLFKFDHVSLLLWPCVLLVDLLAIGLALLTASLAAVVVVLVLTLTVTAVWIFRLPAATAIDSSMLFVLGGFAVLFFAAGMYLTRRLGARLAGSEPTVFGDARTQLPAMSALLPFLLLIMMTQRLPLANPSSLFGLALLLVVLTLGLAGIFTLEWLAACALAGVTALEYAWHARHFGVADPRVALGWYLLFALAFTIYPLLFRRRFAALTGPWAASALASVLAFPLVYRVVERGWPNDCMGVLPALFSLPPLALLLAVLQSTATSERARLNQLAWFGGVALLFITLIFPIQFERQWITIGWALEGVALLWLFHRVPHPGLRAIGFVLLVTAFVRLGLNASVLGYHARSAAPIWNWYLYSYGLVTACLFVGARIVRGDGAERVRVLGANAAAVLGTLGTVLAFLLLNIEIADFFSPPGTRTLTFQFSGNFARDMSYTIAWALFALGLLLISIWKDMRGGRYAALGLLGVTVLKLFLHDLARLEALYRIGALFAVAVIAIIASFAYQRFLPSHQKHDQ